jgi:hypothetical protein
VGPELVAPSGHPVPGEVSRDDEVGIAGRASVAIDSAIAPARMIPAVRSEGRDTPPQAKHPVAIAA